MDPIVGIAADPSTGGYWEVASDSSVCSYRTLRSSAVPAASTLNKPIVGMESSPKRAGLGVPWLLTAASSPTGRLTSTAAPAASSLAAPMVGITAARTESHPTDGSGWRRQTTTSSPSAAPPTSAESTARRADEGQGAGGVYTTGRGSLATELHLTVAGRAGWLLVRAEEKARHRVSGDMDGAHRHGEDAVHRNKRRPEPGTSGNVVSRNRSTSSCCNSVWSSRPLPHICSSSPGSSLSVPNGRHDVAGDETRRACRDVAAPRGSGLTQRVGHDVLGQRTRLIANDRGDQISEISESDPGQKSHEEDVDVPQTEQERTSMTVAAQSRSRWRLGR